MDTRRLTILLTLLITLIAVILPLGEPTLVQADATGFALTQTALGPNETISIEFGVLTRDCDDIYTTSDIYIVPTGSVDVGDSLPGLDPSGAPNTITSTSLDRGILGETIGFTAPSGSIGIGTWDVVEDTCQDGIFNGSDTVLSPGFTVTIPPDIPDLPTDTFNQVKSEAGSLANQWRAGARSTGAMFIAYDLYVLLGGFYDPFILFYYRATLPFILRVQLGVIDTLNDEASHWNGIAADPPDPNFVTPVEVGPTDRFQVESSDPVEAAVVKLGNLWGVNEALSQAFLASLEKYQGARAAGNGAAALMHAHNVRQYATLLAANFNETNPAIDDMLAQLQASGRDVEGLYAQFRTDQIRISTNGLSTTEIRELRNLGTPESGLDTARQDFLAADFTAFQDIGGLTTFYNSLKTQNSATATALQNMVTAMEGVITTLAGQSALDIIPIANPGGPYSGQEGITIAFDGRGSTDPQGQSLTYAWDMDGDGQFDDATGSTPSFTYSSGFTGLVGLRVVNSSGHSNLAYALITITEVNQPPTFVSLTPANNDLVELVIGNAQTFQADVTDPNGDPVTITWLVNGSPAGNGVNFTFNATAGNAGVNTVKVQASDNHPLGGSTDPSWVVLSLYPDADTDGWRANTDCDDTDPGVNPAGVEIPGNGKDDDCNPATLDGSATAYTISGRVTDNSNMPLANVLLTASSGLTVTTNASGVYTFTNLISGSYTITPSLTGHSFSPTSYTIDVPPDRAEQNFIAITQTNSVVIPYLDTGYRYKIVAHDAEPGFEQPGFSDSDFAIGNAGFGTSSGGCSLNNPTDVQTEWPADTDILLRKTFNLPYGASNLRVSGGIDNDLQVFINGYDISGGLQIFDGCPSRDSFVFSAPDNILITGSNLLAVRGKDRGAVTFLDVEITVDLNEAPGNTSTYLPIVLK